MAIRQPQKPGFYYGWVIVAGAWTMYMLNQAAFTWGFTVFVNPLAEEFGWSRTSITIAWALSLTWGLLLGNGIRFRSSQQNWFFVSSISH